MKPTFLIDENLPRSVASDLRRKGYKAFHVNELFRQGFTDRFLRSYVEDKKLVIFTRDVGFSEPRTAGDRVLVIDVPKVTAIDEILTRIKELGW